MHNDEMFTHFDTAFNQTIEKSQEIRIYEKNQSLVHPNTAVANVRLE